MKRALAIGLVLWVQLVGVANADLNALVTFTLGTNAPVTKVEIVRDAVTLNATTSYYPCAASFCAVVPQPSAAGNYNYSVRITDNVGAVGVSNTVILTIANPPQPACQGVSVVVTTGTPTPVNTPAATLTKTP